MNLQLYSFLLYSLVMQAMACLPWIPIYFSSSPVEAIPGNLAFVARINISAQLLLAPKRAGLITLTRITRENCSILLHCPSLILLILIGGLDWVEVFLWHIRIWESNSKGSVVLIKHLSAVHGEDPFLTFLQASGTIRKISQCDIFF